MKDTKSFLLLLALLLAVLLWLRKRPKPIYTQTSVQLIGARSATGELNPAFQGDITNELSQTFTRICRYSGVAIAWPSITEPCPPSFNGQSLISDSLEQKL